MTYEWPLVASEEEFIVSNFSELNSLSVHISAHSFIEILSVRRPDISESEKQIISKFIGVLTKIAERENLFRATDKANKFGQEYRNVTAKLVAFYFNSKKMSISQNLSSEDLVANVKFDLEQYLQSEFISLNGDNSKLKFSTELAAEYLIIIEINKYGNPKIPAADIYLHHPLVDLAASFALVVHLLTWAPSNL